MADFQSKYAFAFDEEDSDDHQEVIQSQISKDQLLLWGDDETNQQDSINDKQKEQVIQKEVVEQIPSNNFIPNQIFENNQKDSFQKEEIKNSTNLAKTEEISKQFLVIPPENTIIKENLPLEKPFIIQENEDANKKEEVKQKFNEKQSKTIDVIQSKIIPIVNENTERNPAKYQRLNNQQFLKASMQLTNTLKLFLDQSDDDSSDSEQEIPKSSLTKGFQKQATPSVSQVESKRDDGQNESKVQDQVQEEKEQLIQDTFLKTEELKNSIIQEIQTNVQDSQLKEIDQIKLNQSEIVEEEKDLYTQNNQMRQDQDLKDQQLGLISDQSQVNSVQKDQIKTISNYLDQQEDKPLDFPQQHLIQTIISEQNPYQMPQISINSEDHDLIDFSLPNFESFFQISQIQAVQQIRQQDQDLLINYSEYHSPENQEIKSNKQHQNKFFLNFQQGKIAILNQPNKRIQIVSFQDISQQIIFNCLGKILHENKVYNPSFKEQVFSGIGNYLELEERSKITKQEKQTWSILQLIIGNSIWNNKKLRVPLLLNQDPNNQQFKQQVIDNLLEGKSLIEEVQNLPLLKDKDLIEEQLLIKKQEEGIKLSQAINYKDYSFNYDTKSSFVQGLIQSQKWSDALLFSTLLGSEKDRNDILFQYIKVNYQQSNPMYTLIMIMLDRFDEQHIAENIELIKNWKIHLAFLLQNSLQHSELYLKIKTFILNLSNVIQQQEKDLRSFLYLRLIINDLQIKDLALNSSSFSSVYMTLSINFLLQIAEVINAKGGDPTRALVELAFQRSLIYSKVLQLHEEAHEELHFVVENRELLENRIKKSQYFQFVLREMKQNEFTLMRKQKKTQSFQKQNQELLKSQVAQSDEKNIKEKQTVQEDIKKIQTPIKEKELIQEVNEINRSLVHSAPQVSETKSNQHIEQIIDKSDYQASQQPSVQIKEVVSQTPAQNQQNQGYFQGFKGLFKKVIDKAIPATIKGQATQNTIQQIQQKQEPSERVLDVEKITKSFQESKSKQDSDTDKPKKEIVQNNPQTEDQKIENSFQTFQQSPQIMNQHPRPPPGFKVPPRYAPPPHSHIANEQLITQVQTKKQQELIKQLQEIEIQEQKTGSQLKDPFAKAQPKSNIIKTNQGLSQPRYANLLEIQQERSSTSFSSISITDSQNKK